MISPQTIEKIRDLNILDVVEKYIEPAKKQGSGYVCHCPWHKDTHPSLSIWPKKNIVRCFVCDKSANPISLAMEVKNLPYVEAVRMLAADFNIKIEEIGKKAASDEETKHFKELEALVIANSWAADWYHNQLLSVLEKHFPENQYYNYAIVTAESSDFESKQESNDWEEKRTAGYIASRFAWNYDIIKKFKIGYAPSGYNNLYQAAVKAGFNVDVLVKAGLCRQKDNGYIDCFIFRPLLFPIHSMRGSIVGFSARKKPWDDGKDKNGKPYPKYINTSDTPVYTKSKILYGFDFDTQGAIRKADKVYIVEGNTDKTSLYRIGIKNAVAKSGTALTDEQIENLKKLTKNICLLDDGDNAGQLSMQKNGEKLTMAKCNVTVLTLPDKQDPDSFFKTEESFREFEKANERDYLIDIRAIDELEGATTLQQKKKVKMAVAELLLQKPKEDRDEYVKEIVKGSDTSKLEWTEAIKQASLNIRNKGLNESEEDKENKVEPDNSKENFIRHNFYYLKKDKAGKPYGIEFEETNFHTRLKSTEEWIIEKNGKTKVFYFGFFVYTISSDEEEMIFVQLKHGRIKRVSINFIKRTFTEFVRALSPVMYEGRNKDGFEYQYMVTNKMIESLLVKKITILFEQKKLILYPDKKITLLQDTLDKHYTFFSNCYVISTAKGYTVHDYESLKDGYVWEDAVLDREFKEPKDNTPGVFEKFVHDITGNNWDLEKNTSLYPEKIRYKSLLIAGGYLVHNYTDIQRKAVILTQGRISEEDTSEGREGKTLFVETIGRYMLNRDPLASKTFIYVPGKDLKSDDKHKWQDLELNTTCVLYDDPPPWINFEDLYNVAERAFKVEKKRQDNIYIMARVFLTTNRPLERDSGSSRARSCVIELDSIFHDGFGPDAKYGHRFIRDWKQEFEDEWNKFSKYVVGTMLPEYFRNNCALLEPPSKNLYRNELLQKARRLSGSMEVIFWLDVLVKGTELQEPFLKVTETYRSKELYDKLLQDRGDLADNKKLKSQFSKILKSYFEKESISFIQDRDSTGTTFKILGGLKAYTKFNKQLISDFFNNGNGYKIDDVDNKELLPKITEDFNKKFNTNVTAGALVEAIDELTGIEQVKDGELPF